MGWIREVYELPEDHGWTATPGHKILVLDAGAVVVEFPADWVAAPAVGHVNVRDGATPADSTCQLAVSCLRIPSVDWSGLPLSNRSEEHTSELQSQSKLVCRPLLEKK